jgi:ferredoxin
VAGPAYTIHIDRELCMGSGVCVVYAPRTFEIDDETKSTVTDAAGDPLEQIRTAAAGCPTGAITVTVEPDAGTEPAPGGPHGCARH